MINFKKRSAIFKSCLVALGLQAGSVSFADDTEIYFSDALTDANPNVMFVLDVSGSMAEEVEGSNKTKFESMKTALQTVLDGASSNVNVGLMNYGEMPYRNEAHGVKFPITNIDSLARPVLTDALPQHDNGEIAWVYSNRHEPTETITVRSYLSEITDWYWRDESWYEVEKEGEALGDLNPAGGTPIVGALFEAAMYFRGEKVTFGVRNKETDGGSEDIEGYAHHTNRWSAHPSTYYGTLTGQKCGTTSTQTIDKNTTAIPAWYKCPANAGDEDSPGFYENCEINEQCEIQTTTVTSTERQLVCEESGWSRERSNYCNGWRSWTCNGGWSYSYGEVCDYQNVQVTEEVEENICEYQVCNENQGEQIEAEYKTPITEVCQNNYIVLLSDGQPTSYEQVTYSSGGRIVTGLNFIENPVYTDLRSGVIPALSDKTDETIMFTYSDCEAEPSGYVSGICGPELTQFLSESDNSELIGTQTINTYAIGFGLGEDAAATNYLKSLVTADDPDTSDVEGFYSVEDEAALSNAFAEILENITATTSSYAAPGYSIDMKNGIHNEDYIYIPVFDKQLAPRWNGNLKKFKLTKTTENGKSVTSITDKFGNIAVSEFGVFEDSAVDFWSTATEAVPDGKDVQKGGTAALIDPETRLALTDIACGTVDCDLLANEANKILGDNFVFTVVDSTLDLVTGLVDDVVGTVIGSNAITSSVLGLDASATEADGVELVNFIRGLELNAETGEYEPEPHVGDMLHTEPVIITYNKDHDTVAGVDGYHQQVLYAATNEGYMHAFDTRSGKELFAFMPSTLMKNIKTQFDNSDLGNHAYGIDGIITSWVHDVNDDDVISAADGDSVLLYFGLRRGGREYYALDVTNPLRPKLKWKINGDTTAGFETLGQTWSAPYLAKVRVDSSSAPREVAIFTGGYDVNQDIEDGSLRAATDTVGNDVFIVDATTGELLWSAQNGGALGGALSNKSLLTHSIPGGARLLDMNSDGSIDRMYFADTSGQVFRLELPTGPDYGLGDAKLIKFADLGGDSSNPRMFYNEPDVALFTHLGRKYLSVSIGSGYRSHPANKVMTDRFYVMLDGAVTSPLETDLNDATKSFTTLTESDLVAISATGNSTISSISTGALEDKTILDVEGKDGWYFVLPEEGEKVLATSVTSQGNVLFTTLVPDAEADELVGDICASPQTQGRYYSMNVLTGTAGSDLNDDGVITDADLMLIVSENEIPGSPQLVFNEPVCTSDSCSQYVDVRVGKRNSALEEQDVSKLESVFWTDPVN